MDRKRAGRKAIRRRQGAVARRRMIGFLAARVKARRAPRPRFPADFAAVCCWLATAERSKCAVAVVAVIMARHPE
jgi:hypothetical protein